MFLSARSYRGLVRMAVRRLAIPPTVGVYDRPLSLTTIRTGRAAAARLLRTSQAMPPVVARSPMAATTGASMPFKALALAMPSAYERLVDACEFSTQSCSDAARLG